LILLSLEDVLPSMNQFITLRFKTKHSVEEVKDALGYLLTVYQKLRSVVEPTLFSYRVRMYEAHDENLKVLFDAAFRVRRHLVFGSDEFIEYRRALLNEPSALEFSLPIKIIYLPDDPNPVLFLAVHHMICDGMGWVNLLNALLSYLNGKTPSFISLDAPGLLSEFIKEPLFKLPAQIYHSYKIYREDARKQKGRKIINPSSRPADFFGPVDVHHHVLSPDEAAVTLKAKKMGGSLSVLLLAVLSITLARRAGIEDGDTLSIIFSIDLRPYFKGKRPVFGNYSGSCIINVPRELCESPGELVKAINTQLIQNMIRLKRKEAIYPMLITKLTTLVGRKNYARGAKFAKAGGLVPMTCAVSNVGDLDKINSHGERAQVAEAIGTTSHQQYRRENQHQFFLP